MGAGQVKKAKRQPGTVPGKMQPRKVSSQIDKIEQDEVDRNDGVRLSGAKLCPFCKHHYIKPCTDKTKASCPNFKHLQSGGKKKQ